MLETRIFRALGTLLVFGLGLGFIYLAWRSLLLFIFALMFAYLLEPLVQRGERWGLRRAWSVAAVYGMLFVASGAALLFVAPRIAHQAARMEELAPQLSQRLSSGQIAQQVAREQGWNAETQDRLRIFVVNHQADLLRLEQRGLAEVSVAAGDIGWILIVPILAIFFLTGGSQAADALIGQLFRGLKRQLASDLLRDMHEVLANYIRAQIILAGLATVIYMAGFELLRLPFALAMAVVAGALEFIPVIGPLSAVVMTVGVALLLDYAHVWALLVFLGCWRLVQDYVNLPRVMAGQVQLPPLAVLFGIFAGAEVGGVAGVYFSIPLMEILCVAWRRWQQFDADRGLILHAGGDAIRPFNSA